MESHKEKLRTAIYTAKLVAYTTGSNDPEKRKKIERLRELTDEAQKLCDEILDEVQKPPEPKHERIQSWRDDPATSSQIHTLKKFRIPHDPGITKGEASDLLDKRWRR